MMRHALLFFIRVYQVCLSPFLGRNCRFTPSCSHYCYEAIELFGPLRGSAKGVWRILRCHPFHPGGYDPVVHDPGKHPYG